MFLCVWGQRSKQKEAEPSTCARLHAEREMMKRGERLGNGRPEPRFSSSSVYKAAPTALFLAGLSSALISVLSSALCWAAVASPQ